jgi:phosphoglycerol transferase MdoB-like AlkP superfamily enzyme
MVLDFTKPDLGGFITLVITALITFLIIYKLKLHEKIYKDFKNSRSLQSITVSILLLISFVSLWLTIRTAMLFIYSYLFIEKFVYMQRDIFNMLALALITNLIFTLCETFLIPSVDKQMKSNTQTDESDGGYKIKSMIDIAIQSSIIGFITFLPRSGDASLTEIGGSINYVSIVIALIGSIFILIVLREKILRKDHN